ncbi:hypothetical protein CV740_14140 [Enterococcus faecium]|nr:hypothetical protein CV740_14140 [Enterococcus faecium]
MVHSDSDLILHNSSVLIDKEPYLLGYLPQIQFFYFSDAVSNASLLSANARSIVRSAKID